MRIRPGGDARARWRALRSQPAVVATTRAAPACQFRLELPSSGAAALQCRRDRRGERNVYVGHATSGLRSSKSGRVASALLTRGLCLDAQRYPCQAATAHGDCAADRARFVRSAEAGSARASPRSDRSWMIRSVRPVRPRVCRVDDHHHRRSTEQAFVSPSPTYSRGVVTACSSTQTARPRGRCRRDRAHRGSPTGGLGLRRHGAAAGRVRMRTSSVISVPSTADDRANNVSRPGQRRVSEDQSTLTGWVCCVIVYYICPQRVPRLSR